MTAIGDSRGRYTPATRGNSANRLMQAASVLALTTTGVLAALAPAALAQSQAASETTVNETGAIAFNLPAQDLNAALLVFADRAGLQLVYDAGLVENLRSAPLMGTFSPQAGLAQLLAGTGLSYRFTGADTVSIFRIATASEDGGPLRTGPVMIGAPAEIKPSDKPFVTPGSTAYISREQIDRVQPSSPGDIFREVPGVLSGASNDGTSINVNIRSAQGLNRVRTMVEGTQQESSGYQGYAGADQRTYIDPELIGGVEIAKGPGGGPYGTGTTAGLVNIRLLDADDLIRDGRDFGFRVRGGLGGNAVAPRFGEFIFDRNADTGLLEDNNDILTDDNWFYSLAGGYRNDRFDIIVAYTERREGNYFAGSNGPETFTYFRDAGRGPERQEARFSPIEPGQETPNTSEATESILLKGTLRLNNEQSLEAGFTRYDSAFGQIFPSSINLWPAQQYALNEVESSRYWLRYKWEAENDLINLQANLWRTTADERGEVRQAPQENKAWGAEIWNASFFDTGLGGLTLTYGAEYARSEAVVDAETLVSGTLFTPGQGPTNVQETLSPAFDGSREVYGGYLNAVFEPTDWLILNAGVRYDRFNAQSVSAGFQCDVDFSQTDELLNQYAEALNRAFQAPTFEEYERLFAQAELILAELNDATLRLDGFCGYAPLNSDIDGDRFSPRAGVTIEPLDGLQIFAQYSEGFRALSLVELGQTVFGPVTVNPDLEPEVVKTWEVGLNYLKDDLLFEDDAFRARLVYFNNDYDNFITRFGALDSRQGGSVFFFDNVPDVTVSGYEVSLFYDARRVFADFNFSGFDQFFDTPTQASIEQPEYAGALTVGTRWFNEDLELGARLNAFGELPLDDVVQASVFSEVSFYWDAQEIVDLFGSYKFNDNVAVGFSVENLTDQYYVPPLFVSRIPSPGRTVRVNMTLQF